MSLLGDLLTFANFQDIFAVKLMPKKRNDNLNHIETQSKTLTNMLIGKSTIAFADLSLAEQYQRLSGVLAIVSQINEKIGKYDLNHRIEGVFNIDELYAQALPILSADGMDETNALPYKMEEAQEQAFSELLEKLFKAIHTSLTPSKSLPAFDRDSVLSWANESFREARRMLARNLNHYLDHEYPLLSTPLPTWKKADAALQQAREARTEALGKIEESKDIIQNIKALLTSSPLHRENFYALQIDAFRIKALQALNELERTKQNSPFYLKWPKALLTKGMKEKIEQYRSDLTRQIENYRDADNALLIAQSREKFGPWAIVMQQQQDKLDALRQKFERKNWFDWVKDIFNPKKRAERQEAKAQYQALKVERDALANNITAPVQTAYEAKGFQQLLRYLPTALINQAANSLSTTAVTVAPSGLITLSDIATTAAPSAATTASDTASIDTLASAETAPAPAITAIEGTNPDEPVGDATDALDAHKTYPISFTDNPFQFHQDFRGRILTMLKSGDMASLSEWVKKLTGTITFKPARKRVSRATGTLTEKTPEGAPSSSTHYIWVALLGQIFTEANKNALLKQLNDDVGIDITITDPKAGNSKTTTQEVFERNLAHPSDSLYDIQSFIKNKFHLAANKITDDELQKCRTRNFILHILNVQLHGSQEERKDLNVMLEDFKDSLIAAGHVQSNVGTTLMASNPLVEEISKMLSGLFDVAPTSVATSTSARVNLMAKKGYGYDAPNKADTTAGLGLVPSLAPPPVTHLSAAP